MDLALRRPAAVSIHSAAIQWKNLSPVLCLICSLFVLACPAMAQQSFEGTPGQAIRSAVVNMTDLARQEALFPPPLLAPRAIHSPMRPPLWPAPTGTKAFEAEQGGQASVLGFSLKTFSPAPADSFLALEENIAVIPPDTMGAVGLNHLMVTLNSQVRIQDRKGKAISTVSLDSFWSRLNIAFTFDPKVLYDPYSNRWIFTACADGDMDTSAVLIGVSQTSDPTGNWNLYKVDADPTNATWADYPSIGFNKNWIVVQLNMFPLHKNEYHSNIYVFDKADLYAGGTGRYTLFSRPYEEVGFTTVPAITYDNTLSTMYLITTHPDFFITFNASFNKLRIFTITGAVGAELLTEGPVVQIPDFCDWFPPYANFAPQAGTSVKIATNDARMQNVVYRNGSLWCTHNAFLPASGGNATRCSVQWYQLTPTGGIQQFGRIDDPTGNVFYAFPTITVNKDNDALLGYSRFSATQYASANYSYRAANDPPNTFQSDVVLKGGEGPYVEDFGSGEVRWGDFSATMVDPVNDTDMWTIQEYAATGNRWSTWWGRIKPPLITLSLNPERVPSGDPSTGTVTLHDPAPPGGAVVTLASDNPSAAAVPGSVTVPGGALSATFEITTFQVNTFTAVAISATYQQETSVATLLVVPPVLAVPFVAPPVGDTNTNFVFSTVYTDPDDNPPDFARVVIIKPDGSTIVRNMTTADTTYWDGSRFAYRTKLSAGAYSFYFWFRVLGRDSFSRTIAGPTVYSAPRLSNPSLSPIIGTASTDFIFGVIYTQAENIAPRYVRLIILNPDGSQTVRSMTTTDTLYSDGSLFTCKTRVPAGTYFYFQCLLIDSAITTNTYVGPTVYSEPALSNPSFSPGTGTVATNFTFSVTYKQADNVVPEYAYAVIVRSDGTKLWKTMTTTDTTYSDGSLYSVTTKLPVGTYTYYFQFKAAGTVVKTPTASGPTVASGPSLSNPSLSPGTGTTDTSFVYSVTYTHPDNVVPEYAYAVIVRSDGTKLWKTMTTTDTTYSDGSLYSVTTKLPVGTYTYYFQFKAAGTVVKDPASGTYAGPTVN